MTKEDENEVGVVSTAHEEQKEPASWSMDSRMNGSLLVRLPSGKPGYSGGPILYGTPREY